MSRFDTLEDAYFKWLVSQIEIEQNGNRPKTYDGLFHCLRKKEFVWTVANDDNRVGDGLDLRIEFLRGSRSPFQNGVSILEVIVALSRRLEFQLEGEARQWAWVLIKNLKLHRMDDPLSYRKDIQIENILEGLIWRNYNPSGLGGFFPLKHAKEDQTKVEIWYQMSAYILELWEMNGFLSDSN